MKKMEIIHLHRLMDKTREKLEEDFSEKVDAESLFSDYEYLEVSPQDLNATKNDQKEALFELINSITKLSHKKAFQENIDDLSNLDTEELSDEEIIGFGGEILSEKNTSKTKAAEKISEIVQYTQRTVYDKLGDYTWPYSPHSAETKNSALSDLESYSENNIGRTKAIQKVSEEYDVPEGTLKTWLTEEEISFTEDIAALLDQESQTELIETAEHYFDFKNNKDPMEQALGKDRDTLRLYKEGKIGTMPVGLLQRLDELFNSEPRYRMNNPERYIEGENGRGLIIDDGFQEFLFSHVSGSKFTEMTGNSSSSYNRHRQNKIKYVDEEAYRKVFQAVSHMYKKHPEPEIEAFLDRNSYSNNSKQLDESILEPEDVQGDIRTLTG